MTSTPRFRRKSSAGSGSSDESPGLYPPSQDPFDRMLIAQAQCEDLVLMTADSALAAYDIRTIDASE